MFWKTNFLKGTNQVFFSTGYQLHPRNKTGIPKNTPWFQSFFLGGFRWHWGRFPWFLNWCPGFCPRYTWRIIPFSKWFITMVIVSPLTGVVPFTNGLSMAYKWGILNYLLTGMILQVPRYFWSWKFWSFLSARPRVIHASHVAPPGQWSRGGELRKRPWCWTTKPPVVWHPQKCRKSKT